MDRIPPDDHAPTALAEAPPAPPRRFVVAYHEDRSDLAELPDGGEVTVGRSREATLVVASEQVSRLHARIRRRGEAVTVEDLGSRNGTFVGAVRIARETAVPPGEAISVGPATILVATAGAAAGSRAAGGRGPALESFDALGDAIWAECVRARATGRRAALAMLRIDGRPEAVGAAQAAVLARLRPFDRAAAYGPHELCILRPEESAGEAARAAEGLLAAVAGVEGARAVAGIAGYPEDATDGDRLLALAREAMRAAGRGGAAVARAAASASPGDAAGEDDSNAAGALRRPARRGGDPEAPPIAADPLMQKTLELCARVAPTPLTVLLLGETGAGKEVVAREIHRKSRRAAGPFVAVNCAALPETLLESELFGHERGAFTGASRRREGWFERAVGGTLLLDEIGDLGPDLQAKLLRAIERKAIVRVGGTEEIEVDTRVVAATHHDLEAAARAGTFRQDLWFRLSAFVVVVPPLRDRPADVEPLADRFLAEMAAEMNVPAPALSREARAALRGHGWPGNVRELRNVVERALVLSDGGDVDLEHLPAWAEAAWESGAAEETSPGVPIGAAPPQAVDRITALERAAIVEALASAGGNQTRAAQLLGLSRRALIYRMEKHGLKPRPAG